MRSVFNSDKYPLLNISTNEINITNSIPIPKMTPEIYGMSIHPALNICSIYNENHLIRKMIMERDLDLIIKNYR